MRVRAVVKLLKGHNSRIQLRAAEAVEALVDHNEQCQKAFLNPQFDTPAALIRLLKVRFDNCFVSIVALMSAFTCT